MPLVRIDLHEGRAEQELAAIGYAVHQAMVETIGGPGGRPLDAVYADLVAG
jgi:hypothetical protein